MQHSVGALVGWGFWGLVIGRSGRVWPLSYLLLVQRPTMESEASDCTILITVMIMMMPMTTSIVPVHPRSVWCGSCGGKRCPFFAARVFGDFPPSLDRVPFFFGRLRGMNSFCSRFGLGRVLRAKSHRLAPLKVFVWQGSQSSTLPTLLFLQLPPRSLWDFNGLCKTS